MKDGRISHTALKIARMGVYFGQHPDFAPLLPAGMADANRALLDQLDLLKPWHLWAYRSRVFEVTVQTTDRVVGPGYLIHFPLRKRLVHDQVAAAVARGATQLLVLGAGLDSLAVRWADTHPDVLCVELDHPATGAPKRRATHDAGLARDNLVQHAVDLSVVPLADALAQTPWDATQPSVVVAEGLLMYLPHDAVRALFTAVAGLSGPGSAFVFTWLPCDDQGRMDLDRITQLGVKVVGEPIHFAMQPDRLGAFVGALGWDLQPDVDLRAAYLAGTPLADTPLTRVERFSVATR